MVMDFLSSIFYWVNQPKVRIMYFYLKEEKKSATLFILWVTYHWEYSTLQELMHFYLHFIL